VSGAFALGPCVALRNDGAVERDDGGVAHACEQRSLLVRTSAHPARAARAARALLCSHGSHDTLHGGSGVSVGRQQRGAGERGRQAGAHQGCDQRLHGGHRSGRVPPRSGRPWRCRAAWWRSNACSAGAHGWTTHAAREQRRVAQKAPVLCARAVLCRVVVHAHLVFAVELKRLFVKC
jgi:hypothetical protein